MMHAVMFTLNKQSSRFCSLFIFILNKIISFSQLFPGKKLKKHHSSWCFTKNSLRNIYNFIFVRKVYGFSRQVTHKFQIMKSHRTHACALHKISSKLWLRSKISLSSLTTKIYSLKCYCDQKIHFSLSFRF